MTKVERPTGAITDKAAWDKLPRSSKRYLVNQHGEIFTHQPHDLSILNQEIWNVGPPCERWPYDFAFSNYWFAYAYSLQRRKP